MPHKKVNPRYRVVSVRLSEVEHAFLKDATVESNSSLSELMREAVLSLMANAPDGHRMAPVDKSSIP